MNYDINYRPYGTFQQVNVAGVFLATSLPICLYALHCNQSSKLSRHRTLISLALLITTIFSTFSLTIISSRTALIGAISSVIIILIASTFSFKKDSKTRKAYAIAITLGLLLSVLNSNSNLTPPSRDLTNKNSLETRMATYTSALEMISQKPIAGWGYGNYEKSYIEFRADKYSLSNDYPLGIPYPVHPHNEFLLWTVEGGIPALIIIVALISYYIFKTYRYPESYLTYAMLFPLSFACMTEFPFYNAPSLWFLFISLIYLGDRTTTFTQKLKKPQFLQASTLVIVLLASLLFLGNLQAIKQMTLFQKSGLPNHLYSIISPIGLKKTYELNMYYARYEIAKISNNKKEILAFAEWVEDFVTSQPRVTLYKMWAESLIILGYSEYATEVIKESNHLFPLEQISYSDGEVMIQH